MLSYRSACWHPLAKHPSLHLSHSQCPLHPESSRARLLLLTHPDLQHRHSALHVMPDQNCPTVQDSQSKAGLVLLLDAFAWRILQLMHMQKVGKLGRECKDNALVAEQHIFSADHGT